MAKVWAGAFTVLLMASLVVPEVLAEEDERDTVLSDEFQTHGPVWFSTTCLHVSCSGMELVLWYNLSLIHI